MHKELVLRVPSTEPEVEVSVRNYAGQDGFVLLEHNGNKFGVSAEDLKACLYELDMFNRLNKTNKDEELINDIASRDGELIKKLATGEVKNV